MDRMPGPGGEGTAAAAELRDSGAFGSAAARYARHDDIDASIARWARVHSPEEAASALQNDGVCASPVSSPRMLADDPHLAARGLFATTVDSCTDLSGGERNQSYRCVDLPWRFERTPIDAAKYPPETAPKIGQNTQTVLSEVAGMDAAEIQALLAENATKEREY